MKNAVIFDLDGTLWDSSEQVIKSWNEVLKRYPKFNKQITAEEMRGYMGKPMYDIARLMLPGASETEIRTVMDECCEHENIYLGTHGGVLYPELEATLEKLHKNFSLYIVSNCQEGYIQTFLKFYCLEKYFEDIECQGRTGLTKAENISLIIRRCNIDRAVYVGDTELDAESAEKAGIPFIHASYGFGKINKAVPVIKSFACLTELLPDLYTPKEF